MEDKTSAAPPEWMAMEHSRIAARRRVLTGRTTPARRLGFAAVWPLARPASVSGFSQLAQVSAVLTRA